MNTEHSWSEYAASYTLGALDHEERAAFEAHLADCMLCRAEVQAYREVTHALAHSAPAVAAPPALRQRIVTEARKVRPIGSARSAQAQPERGGRTLPWIAVAACLAAALGLGALYYNERADRLAADHQAQSTQAELAATRTELGRADSLVAVLLAPNILTAALAAQGRPPSARLYYNPARNVVVVAAFDLPPAAAGRTYQLWGLTGGQPTSLGTFNTGADRRAVLALRVPSGARFELSAITDEPAGGSPLPTTTPFLVGAWTIP